MKITVVIPAFNRPALLRVALQSVAAQTALTKVVRVVVSENGLNRASETVCQEFSHLPIEYHFHEQQLPVLQHLRWALSQEQEHFVALLCDDDWWDANHLALAAQGLAEYPDCQAYFSNFLYYREESAIRITPNVGLQAMHLGNKDFVNYKPTVYRLPEIAMISLMITPFHFSAVVCAGKLLADTVAVFETVHPTYADRMLWVVLAEHTAMIFNPLPTAMIRAHDDMDSRRYSIAEWHKALQEGSLRVLAFAKERGVPSDEQLNAAYHSGSVRDSQFITSQLSTMFYDRQKISWFAGIADISAQDKQAASLKNKVKQYSKRVLSKVYRTI